MHLKIIMRYGSYIVYQLNSVQNILLIVCDWVINFLLEKLKLI